MTARARREDVENDFGAIHHAHAEALLELDALYGREALVEEQQRRAGRGQLVFQRFDLALAEVEVRRRGIDPLDGPADHLSAGGIGEAFELFEMLVDVRGIVGAFAWGPDEKCPLYGRLNLNESTGHGMSFLSGTLPLLLSWTLRSPIGVSSTTAPVKP